MGFHTLCGAQRRQLRLGDLFLRVAKQHAGDISYIVQGTMRGDVHYFGVDRADRDPSRNVVETFLDRQMREFVSQVLDRCVAVHDARLDENQRIA